MWFGLNLIDGAQEDEAYICYLGMIDLEMQY